MQELPVKIKTKKVESDKPNPPIGVGLMCWSFDSKLLATRDDNMPHCLWIWDMSSLELSNLLVHYTPIKSVSWSPKSAHLAFSTGTAQVFLWSREGASVCTIPIEAKGFSVHRVQWNPDGKSLMVVDKLRLTVACPQPEFFTQSDIKNYMHGEDSVNVDYEINS